MVIQPGGDSGGVIVGTAATSEAALPTLANGANPKWVYICVTIAKEVAIAFTFGGSGVSAADEPIPAAPTLTAGITVNFEGGGIIVNVAGHTHYRAIATASGSVATITPLAGVVPGG